MNGEEEKEKIRLTGKIFQVKRKGPGDFVDVVQDGLGSAVRLPSQQAELVAEYLKGDKDCFFWIYRRRDVNENWRGVVMAGPFGAEVSQDPSLLTDEQRERWFNQGEMDLVGKTPNETMEKIRRNFRSIWDRFSRNRLKVAYQS